MKAWAIDPGSERGAAACVRWARPESTADAFDLVTAVAWRRSPVGYVVQSVTGKEWSVAHLGLLGPTLALLGGPYTVACEGLYVPSLERAPSILTLAVSAGEVLGGLRAYQQGDTLRPHPSTWRGRMLGSAALGAKAAAKRAIEVAALRLRPGLGALSDNDHAADAALMACWAAVEVSR